MFFGIGLIVAITGCIPVVSWFLAGPLLVGVYYAMLRQYSGQNVEFGMLSIGFSKFFPALIVGFLLLLPGIVVNGYRTGLSIAQALAIYNPNELTGGMVAIMGIISLLINGFALIGGFILGISLVFAPLLLAEHDLSAIQAIKLSAKAGWGNFGGLFVLFLLLGLLLIGGVLALCIGIFFVIPILYAAFTVAYRQVFPSPHNPNHFNAPPPPPNYGNMHGQSI